MPQTKSEALEARARASAFPLRTSARYLESFNLNELRVLINNFQRDYEFARNTCGQFGDYVGKGVHLSGDEQCVTCGHTSEHEVNTHTTWAFWVCAHVDEKFFPIHILCITGTSSQAPHSMFLPANTPQLWNA